jgi:pre-mRNA-splicing factor SPF27
MSDSFPIGVLMFGTQIQIGKELNSLEARWTELISNVLQIELANVALEQEVESLRQQELDME